MSVTESAEDALGSRIVAFLLDFVLLTVISGIIWLVFSIVTAVLAIGGAVAMSSGSGAAAGGGGISSGISLLGIVVSLVMWVVIGGLLFAYYGFLGAEGRQTLGMRLIDVRVVDAGGNPATRRQSFIRTAVLLAPLPLMALLQAIVPLGFFFALGLMGLWLFVELGAMVLSDDTQRLGDRFADTFVVEDGLATQAAQTT